MAQDGSSTVRFSTADLPEEDRVAMCREHYNRIRLKLDFDPATDTAFECAVATRALPGVKLMSTRMSAVRMTRTREQAASDNDDLVFILNQNGSATVCSRGREVKLDVGDAVLMSTAETKTFDRHSHGGALSLRIPHSVLSSIVPHVDDTVMQLIPRHLGVLELLRGYAGPLLGENVSVPGIQRTAVNHLHDLVALALGATHDGADLARGRGLPAARLRLAKAYIMENSQRRDLSVGVVAAHFGLTPRNLQRLFESESTTFSEFLLTQRLIRAHRMLTEPRLALSAVGAIAYDAGFGDLSYFNRSFKRRYGATPRDVRNTGHAIEQVS